jgi:hypothetical protein
VSGAATDSLSESQSSNTRPASRIVLPTTALLSLKARVQSPNMISTRRWSRKRTVRSEDSDRVAQPARPRSLWCYQRNLLPTQSPFETLLRCQLCLRQYDLSPSQSRQTTQCVITDTSPSHSATAHHHHRTLDLWSA